MPFSTIFDYFGFPEGLQLAPLGSGNINDTWLGTSVKGEKLVLQRINTIVFPYPDRIMHNYRVVLGHLQQKNIALKLPKLLPGIDGQGYLFDEEGNCWRAVEYLPNSTAVEHAESPQQAQHGAAAVGVFLNGLADLDPHLVQDTLPGFHDSLSRFQHFQKAVEKDAVGRLAEVRDEVAFVQKEAQVFQHIHDLGLPLRVVHNDPKIANVLFDARNGEAIAVIDWDTIQAGSILSDFGDMVRSMTPSFSEDEADLNKVEVVLPLFEALARGFVPKIQSALAPVEKDNLLQGAFWIILEQMMRFLGDYLNGDVYYKVRYAEHNLVRARNQGALYQSIRKREAEMEAILKRYF